MYFKFMFVHRGREDVITHHTTCLYITNALVLLPVVKWVIKNLPGIYRNTLLVSRHTDAMVVGMV
jgi:hypothetical protein